ncbi:GspE/PulE family protein [Fluviispira sanaruensis]|uniref:Type II secretion system protein GspE n=1 Tax=Fluviispira sanaruensis TaxID=2493639 RepID=A0A4P2VHT8_FLUSA|nr:ATPase, T2SS/T4P/T4SS family [Fluviispira sanaruensis]BBH52573.1 type II secretion system protein GspE [Fluviispira sanaruensis]
MPTKPFEKENIVNLDDILSKITLKKSVEEYPELLNKNKTFEDILIEKFRITQKQIDEALIEQATNNIHIGDILVENDVLQETDKAKALAIFLNLEFQEHFPYNEINPKIIRNLNISFCLQHMILPIAEDDLNVTVAVSNPLDTISIDDLRVILNKNIKRIVAPRDFIEGAINNVFERQELADQGKGLTADDDIGGIEGLDVAHNLLQDNEEAPVRKEVTAIIRRSITEKASDIHIEPFEDRVSVRFRIDGRLREVRVIPKKYQSSVTTRIKILAKLNIAESRLPQDGRITLKVGTREIDVRVSTLPIKFGERIVLRILDKSGGMPDLDDIGMPKMLLKNFKTIINQKHGIVLVTGPTGSGKTTTLASALMSINKPDVSIITVEDPVEIQLPGVSQVEVNEKAGLTFAAALRSILRQNPNIILIGEIRDSETAQIAVQASITGHLVLSTLHTNDTAASVTRLVDFGIEPFQITTAVVGILAVRLVRKVCQTCRVQTVHTAEELGLLGLSAKQTEGKVFYKAKENGCQACKSSGYSGRIGIYELLVFDEHIRNFVLKSSDGASLKRMCVQRGMKTLRDSAQERFLKGETTLEEALFATQTESDNEVL